MVYMDFFKRFKGLAKEKNTTIEALVKEILEKDRAAYYGWRRRKVLPRADEAVKIAKALNTTVEHLVTGEKTIIPGLSPESLEIARIFESLPADIREGAATYIRFLKANQDKADREAAAGPPPRRRDPRKTG
jgi:transcriptional regulator with XRE-family HTH domain